jgi:hypothetical protein
MGVFNDNQNCALNQAFIDLFIARLDFLRLPPVS